MISTKQARLVLKKSPRVLEKKVEEEEEEEDEW